MQIRTPGRLGAWLKAQSWTSIPNLDRLYPWGPLDGLDWDEAYGCGVDLSTYCEYPGADVVMWKEGKTYSLGLIPQAETSGVWLLRFHNGEVL